MAAVHGLTIESVPIDSLIPHPRNVRQGDLGSVIESVKANGCYRPLIVQRSTRHILAGNHLWRALKSLGYQQVDAVFIDCDDERALRIMLADDRTSCTSTSPDIRRRTGSSNNCVRPFPCPVSLRHPRP